MVEASSQSGLVSALAPALGTLAGGLLADRLARRSVAWLGALPALCCVLAVPIYLAAGFVASVDAMIVLVGFGGFLIGLMVPAGYAALHSVTGARDRALGIAVAFFFLNLVGYGAGPAAIGLLSDGLRAQFGEASIAAALGIAILVLIPSAFSFARAGWRMRADAQSTNLPENNP